MRKLSQAEIDRATGPRASRYVAATAARNPSTPPRIDGIVRSVILDGESVFVDVKSYIQVCSKSGADPDRVV